MVGTKEHSVRTWRLLEREGVEQAALGVEAVEAAGSPARLAAASGSFEICSGSSLYFAGPMRARVLARRVQSPASAAQLPETNAACISPSSWNGKGTKSRCSRGGRSPNHLRTATS